jgi:hypothetical protein
MIANLVSRSPAESGTRADDYRFFLYHLDDHLKWATPPSQGETASRQVVMAALALEAVLPSAQNH